MALYRSIIIIPVLDKLYIDHRGFSDTVLMIIITIQYLYSAMKSEDTEVLGCTRLRMVK